LFRSAQRPTSHFDSLILRAAILVVAALGPLAGCSGGPTEEKPDSASALPAVVLITVDGVSAEDLAIYGGQVETPNLTRLAESGTTWSNAFTPCPMSRPAAASYLTALAPDRSGIRDDLFTSLDPGVPTLATALRAAGYRTAAFPDSSLLGFSSGLLRDFELVADPPPVPINPARWIPVVRPAAEVAGDFGAWLETLRGGERYFGWLHFSDPLVQRVTRHGRKLPGSSLQRRKDQGKEISVEPPSDDGVEAYRTAIGELDTAIGHILSALEVHGEGNEALVIVAGTQADPSGGENDLPGPGFSLGDQAIRVPLVARPPDGRGAGVVDLSAVWAPDVPRTIADLAGVELSPRAEGTNLLEEIDPDRILFAWSWATRDQMGWRASRSARGSGLVRVEGLETRTEGVEDAEAEARLIEALASREEPPVARVDIETIRPILEKRGLTLRPVPEEGRDFGPAERRRTVAGLMWNARVWMHYMAIPKALPAFGNALTEDPEALGALLDRGQLMALTGSQRKKRPLDTAVELYPTDPEVVHWYAHSIWQDSLEDAEALLTAILPSKLDDSDLLYDLACARSIAGDLDASEAHLRSAVEAGFREWDLMENDPDLRNLRESGRYSAVVQEYTR